MDALLALAQWFVQYVGIAVCICAPWRFVPVLLERDRRMF